MARLFLPIVLLFLFYLFYLPSGYAGNGIGEKITFTGNYGYTIIGNTENTGEAANECGEVNGTSRYLNIPSGATVHKAYLYWSGSSYYASNAVYIDQSVTLNSQNVAADDAWTETINNGGYYQDFYAAYADVTSKITGSGNITIDNLSFDKVVSCPYGSVYGGWSLVVIYTKSDLPNRTIKMYDGFYGYWPNPIKNFYQQWDLDGFTIPNCQANIELSSIIWEGDNYKGEKTYIDGQYMGDNLLSGSNSFNGSSNYNLDIDRYYLDDILSPGQTDFVYRVESYQVGNAWEFHLDNVFILQYDNCENTCKPTVKFTNSDCSSVTVKKGTTTVATITGGGFWNGDASDGDVFDFYLSTNKFDSYTVAGCSAQNYTVHPGGCSNYTCPESLVVNPSFENTIQGWTVVGDYNFTTHYAVNGNYVVFIKPSTQGQTATISQNVNVTTGTVYSLDFFAGTHEPSFNHTLSIEFYTQAGTLLGSQSVQVDHDVDPNQDLKAYNLTMTAPQGSRYVKIIGRASGDYLKLDALCLTGNPCDATDLICEYNTGSGWITDDDCVVNVCSGSSLWLSVNPNGMSSYVWSGPNGFSGNGDKDGNILISNSITTASNGVYSVTSTDNKGCTSTKSITVNVSNLSLNIVAYNVNCAGDNDGGLDLSVTGGVAPLTYSWSNGTKTEDIDGLSPGDYSVTVTDAAGCSAAKKATINQPSKIDAWTEYTDVTCGGGSDGTITLSVIGGTTPYKYLWSNGATTKNLSGLSTGDYSVTITDANGCTKAIKRWIDQPDKIDATLTVTNTGCQGGASGAIALTVSGGTTPYSYHWSNGATTKNISNLSGGNYSVTITDNGGCTLVKSASVNSSGGPLVNIACSSDPLTSRTVSNSHQSCGSHVSYGFWNDNLAEAYTNNPYWSVQSGSLKEYDNGTAYLEMNVVNIGNAKISFTIKAVFKGRTFSPPADSPKENTQCVGDISNQDWYYYTETYGYAIGGGDLAGALLQFDRNGPAFQVGTGANLNTGTVFGASGWLNLSIISQPSSGPALNNNALHGDFNINLSGSTLPREQECLLTCAGNSVTLTAAPNAGTAPYSYSWSTGSHAASISVSPNTTTTYRVTVTDANGCSTTDEATVTVSQSMEASIQKVDISCHGANDGSIDLSVTAGTGPFTFLWSNGATTEDITGLQSGDYYVTITDGAGCELEKEASINEPAALYLSIQTVSEACTGNGDGTINLTVSGGTAPYRYHWSNGATTEDLTGVSAGSYSVTVTDASDCSASDNAMINSSEPMVLTLTPSPASCADNQDGSIDLQVQGGKSPYKFAWSNGATTEDLEGLGAGTYSVTVTDVNGCTANDEAKVSEPNPLQLYAGTEDPLCHNDENGSIDLTVSGGTTPYSYQWSNGATTEDLNNLSAGSYSVTVTDKNGCNATKALNIAAPETLTITVDHVNANCDAANGEATAQPQGGTSPYTYLWSNGATTADIGSLGSGNYSVTVTDAHGCTADADVFINGYSNLAASATATDASCPGSDDGSIVLTVTGNSSAVTYKWSNGSTTEDLTGVPAGTYTVTVTDAFGCTAEAGGSIKNKTSIQVSAIPTGIDCNGSANGSIMLIVQGGVSPYTYLWNTGATTKNISGLVAGNYTVTVTDLNGCSSEASTRIDEPKPLEVSLTGSDLSCFDDHDGSIQATVLGGTTPFHFLWSNGATTQNISGLKGGLYSVTVTDANGCTAQAEKNLTRPDSLYVNLDHVDANCDASNGQATAIPGGGIAPYTFAWSDGQTTQSITSLPTGNYSVTVTDSKGCLVTGNVFINGKSDIAATAKAKDATCAGVDDGSVDLTVTGSTSALTFKWSNGATTEDLSNVAAGNYSVTVTDAYGCTAEASATIKSHSTISISAIPSAANCNGSTDGTIELIIQGAVSPITYHWSNGATTKNLTGLAAGSYTVTVTDANGCPAEATTTIEEPEPLDIILTKSDITCDGFDGTISASVSGGTAPYKYIWSNGATTQSLTGLQPGTYSVTVSDKNKCSQVASATIEKGNGLLITIEASDASCNGSSDGSISVDVQGGVAPYAYLWSNGVTTSEINGLGYGTYGVTVTDVNGCSASGEAKVNIPDAINLDLVGSGTTCQGGDGQATVTATGGRFPYQYAWSNGETSKTIKGITAGEYTVTVTDANGCSAAESIIIEPGSGVLTVEAEGGELNCENASVFLTVITSTDVEIFSWTGPGGFTSDEAKPEVNIPGTYSVTVTDANGCSGSGSAEVTSNVDVPEVKVTGENLSCLVNEVQIKATSSIPDVEYMWFGPDGFTSSEQNPIVTKPGKYNVLVTTTQGCIGQGAIEIKLDQAGPDIELKAPDFGCGSSQVQIDMSVSEPNVDILWIGPGGFVSTGEDPIIELPGTYHVSVTGAGGCTTKDDITVGTSGNFELELSADTITCPHPAVTITVTGTDEISSYKWIGPNGYTSDRQTPLVDVPGVYTLVAFSVNGCLDTASVEVIEDTFEPEVQAEGGMITCEQGYIQLYGHSSTPNVIYAWTGPEDFASSEPEPEVSAPGEYTLTVTGANGCKVVTFVTVTKEPCGKIGDKVWLDGNCDGLQDTFEIGVDSILVKLYTCDSVLVAETYSDSSGMYYFENLVPDRYYFVAVDSLPSRFTFAPHIDSIPDSLDTDIILFSSRTECFYVRPGMVDTTIDIGLCAYDTCVLNVEAEEYVISCGMDSIQLIPKVNETGLRYHWESTNGFLSDEERPWVFESGKYYVTASDAYGCEAIACIVVTESSTVDIEVIGGTVPCDGSGTLIYAYSSDEQVIYSWVGPNGFRSLEQNPLVYEPGIYWVTARDTVFGCYDKMMIEVFLECCNVTDGGILIGDEIACGPYDPLPIISIADATGGRGEIQYMWMKTTNPDLPFSLWTMIWDAHGPEYDPGLITETTYYTRCSKRAACEEWVGESNIVVKKVINIPVVDTVYVGSDATCGDNTGEIIIELSAFDDGPYMVRLIVDGVEKIFGPYQGGRIIIDGLAPGRYTSLQISNAYGCFSEVIEIDLEIKWVACAGTEDATDQISIHPNPATNYVQISANLIENGDDDIQIELINLTGNVMKRINKTVDRSSDQLFRDRIDVHDIQAGMYYLRIRHGTEVKFIPVEILK
ncbi:MAG: T9SS type A sorting domain-containing protein [Lewinellaceae bacterium]|nr:T9SS type A sorting domain-containing protein [Lewinellaceae bacterium]